MPMKGGRPAEEYKSEGRAAATCHFQSRDMPRRRVRAGKRALIFVDGNEVGGGGGGVDKEWDRLGLEAKIWISQQAAAQQPSAVNRQPSSADSSDGHRKKS